MIFPDLELKKEYRSPQDDVVKDVFIPALKIAKSYKRAVGFFSSAIFHPPIVSLAFSIDLRLIPPS